MTENNPVPSVLDLDWFGDLTLYQHPPCTFILWYVTLGVKAGYEIIKSLIEMITEGGGGGGEEEGSGEADNAEDGEAPAEEAPADAEETSPDAAEAPPAAEETPAEAEEAPAEAAEAPPEAEEAPAEEGG